MIIIFLKGQKCSHTIDIPDSFKQVTKPWYWQQDPTTQSPPSLAQKRPKLVKKLGQAQQFTSRARYDPFAFHQGSLSSARAKSYPQNDRQIYHSLTDSRLHHVRRPSITWKSPATTTASPVSFVTAATNMRPSVTWKSSDHRQAHFIDSPQKYFYQLKKSSCVCSVLCSNVVSVCNTLKK